MKLGTKLLIVFLLISIVPLAGSGLVARYFSKGILEDKAFDQLTAIRDVKRLEIEGRLTQLDALMQNVRADPRFTTGLPAYAEAFASGGKDGFQYTMVQGERDFQLKVFVEAFKFSDVLLIDRDRNIVYAAKEGPDLGTNLKTGPYRATALARALGDELGDTRFVDFQPYEPAGGPAAFIVTPILDNDLQPVGVAAFRFGVPLLNEIMQARTGLGETGETYLVGPDLRMRSDSVRDPERRTVAASFAAEDTTLLDRPPVKKGLSGRAGAELSAGPDGTVLLTAYAPLEVGELHWTVIADLPRKEAFAAIDRTDLVLLIFGGLGAVVLVLLLPLISRSISNSVAGPIRAVIDGLAAVSAEVASASGQIASSSQSLADSTAEQASNLARSAGTLEQLSARTRDTVERTQEADRISDQNHDEVLKIGAAMNRLLETIRDIKEASDETQKIIKTINEIAFQTNLLALNAAVEAARAGDAGRGFAVVAEEVRNLALRSAEAADSTNTVLETARRRSDAGVSAAEEVGKVLESVQASNEKVKHLINEIVGHSTEQAAGIEEVAQTVAALDARTQDDAAVAQQTASASHQLTAQSENLMRYTADLGRVVGARRGGDNGGKQAPAGRLLEQPRQDQAPGKAAAEKAPPARPAPARKRTARIAPRPAPGRKPPGKAPKPAAEPAAEAPAAPPAEASEAPADAGEAPAQEAKDQPAPRRSTLRDSIAWAEKGPSRPVSPEFPDLGDADFKDM